KTKERTFFLMELAVYRMPRWKNVGITMVEKARVFVTDAGRIIIIISLVLWVLSSFGPPGKMQAVEDSYAQRLAQNPAAEQQLSRELNTAKLENSYAGIMGRSIEPLIQPLGFDWKIGIAIITSFAAREVFVGTMATLYSVGEDDEENKTLRNKMRSARRPD